MPLSSYSTISQSSSSPGLLAGDVLIRAARDEYVESIMMADLARATRVTDALINAGVDIADVYHQLFAPSIATMAGELGSGNLSQSRFTAFLDASRAVMERMVDQHKPLPEFCRALTAVLGCVEGEWHSLGCRMVADLLEVDGWIVHYLGENVDKASFLGSVRSIEPDIVGISVTQFGLLASARQLIQDLCRLECSDRFKIMVGGYPFSVNPGLCREVGGDFTARDAREASHKANRHVSHVIVGQSEFQQLAPYLV